MFRAAMAVVVGGYAFGGLGTGAGHFAFGDTASHAASPGISAYAANAANAATKTVFYRGYQLNVPASWPVYRLDADPSRCVRYDVHAVYLGTPGAEQNCPPGLVGRTETVSIGTPAAGARPPVISQSAVVAGRPAAPVRPGASGAAGAAGAPGVIMQDATVQEFGLAMPSSAPAITATYGADPALIERVLASVRAAVPRQASKEAPRKAPQKAPVPMASTAALRAVTPAPAAGKSGTPAAAPLAASPQAPASAPAASSTAAPSVSPSPPLSPAVTLSKSAQAGFDTCTAPSMKAMQAWRSKFSVSAIYIGGEEMACGYGNLSAQWVQAVKAMGWSLLPTYVGPQASCDSFSGKIDVKKAAAQGRQNAQWAVQDASMLGISKGSPIYYDMEAYNRNKAKCVTGVLEFLDAWTRQLNAEGYISGVYSSADSAVIDLATHTMVGQHMLAKPQAIWCALWDKSSDLNCAPYLPAGPAWPAERRSKQFAGSHWEKVHRIGLNIDSDLVNSAVAR